jgi:ribosomal protein S18 acetylase RimI-like enzyme
MPLLLMSGLSILNTLKFSTINLDVYSDLCVSFRRDAFICSFKDGKNAFEVENGENGEQYLAWLRDRIVEFPQGCVHAYLQNEIVGQLEMRLRNPDLGYINLFYVVPKHRGGSIGSELQSYAELTMAARGIRTLQLTVSTLNKRAIRFYEKHGWRGIRHRDSEKKHLLMELQLVNT